VCAPAGWDPASEEWEVCPCGWRPELRKHYAKASHVQCGASKLKSAKALRLSTVRSVGASASTATRTWDNQRRPLARAATSGIVSDVEADSPPKDEWQGAPVRSRHKMPLMMLRLPAGGCPRPRPPRLPFNRQQHPQNTPLDLCQIAAAQGCPSPTAVRAPRAATPPPRRRAAS